MAANRSFDDSVPAPGLSASASGRRDGAFGVLFAAGNILSLYRRERQLGVSFGPRSRHAEMNRRMRRSSTTSIISISSHWNVLPPLAGDVLTGAVEVAYREAPTASAITVIRATRRTFRAISCRAL